MTTALFLSTFLLLSAGVDAFSPSRGISAITTKTTKTTLFIWDEPEGFGGPAGTAGSWREENVNGNVFYHNIMTGERTYQRPNDPNKVGVVDYAPIYSSPEVQQRAVLDQNPWDPAEVDVSFIDTDRIIMQGRSFDADRHYKSRARSGIEIRRNMIKAHFEAPRRSGQLSKSLCRALVGAEEYDVWRDPMAKDEARVLRKPLFRVRNLIGRIVPTFLKPTYDLAAEYATGGLTSNEVADIVRFAGNRALDRARYEANNIEEFAITLEDVKAALWELQY